MVDLVKIRKKAKERHDGIASSQETRASVAEPLPAPEPGKTRASEPAPAPAKPKHAVHRAGTKAPAAEPPGAPAETAAQESLPDVEPGILDRLEEFKRSAGMRQSTLGEGAELKADGEQLELLTFANGRENYAISIEKIVEIIPPQHPTRVPNAPANVVGIISLRGTIVTILDLRRRLGHPAVAARGDARIIVVENGGETAGFVVDRVLRVIKTDPAKIESHPVVSPSEQSDHILGVFQHGKSLSIYLDLERLMQD